MKKSVLIIVIIVTLIIGIILGIMIGMNMGTTNPNVSTSSSNTTTTTTKPPHTHIEIVDPAVAATCSETGLTEGKHCSVCGEVLVAQETVSKLPHTEVIDEAVESSCTTVGLSEGKHCSVCNEMIVEQFELPVNSHIESDWITDKEVEEGVSGLKHTECTMCGEKIQEISHIGSVGLSLSSYYGGYVYGIGNCQDYDIVIPDIYNETQITYIHKKAFKGNKYLDSVVVGDNVLTIGDEAFRDCDFLKTVVLGNSVTSIGNSAFYECTSLKSIVMPTSLEIIYEWAFAYVKGLTIYYQGTEEQWQNVRKCSDCFYIWSYPTVYYYSAIQPDKSGHYWHYVDGEPIIWK